MWFVCQRFNDKPLSYIWMKNLYHTIFYQLNCCNDNFYTFNHCHIWNFPKYTISIDFLIFLYSFIFCALVYEELLMVNNKLYEFGKAVMLTSNKKEKRDCNIPITTLMHGLLYILIFIAIWIISNTIKKSCKNVYDIYCSSSINSIMTLKGIIMFHA